jgi:SH3 domain protein
MRFPAICRLLLLAHLGVAHAETAYVTDVLRLGLHKAQDTSDQAFETLISGAELEVLRRVPNYAEVATADGEQGWVKSAFLVSDKPAQLIVAETQAALESAEAALAKEEQARIAAETELNRLLNDPDSKLGRAIEMSARIQELEAHNAELETQLDTYRQVVPFNWAASAVVAALLGGFFLGLWSLDAYIRHRHGGFRVY